MAAESDLSTPDTPSTSPFDRIRRVDADGVEYWTSRDLAKELGYAEYRNFEPVVERAKTACTSIGEPIEHHFVDVNDMIEVGKGAERPVTTVWMNRYACYLAVQNANPANPQVALGQTYFAVQTRRQELEDDRRLLLRQEMRTHNTKLAGAAKDAGVVDPRDYAIFQNHGYKGLYGGLTAGDIGQRKGLTKSQQILDHMGSTELAANLFRATQTEEKLRNEQIKGKDKANQAHETVGKRVRLAMKDTGGTYPEDLPTVESIKKLEAKKAKQIKADPPTSD